MTKLLIKLFIKDSDNIKDSEVRTKYGYLGSFVGIVLNILLFCGKLITGLLSGAISVVADALNNLSDAGSSIMSFVGFKMAARPADREHPYGHGRMEYVSGLIISFIIMMMGFELARSSVEKMINPVTSEFNILTLIILIVSVLIKLWMGIFNRKLGKIINSETMKAAAADSLSDCLATSVVIITMLVNLIWHIDLDAYAGALVAMFIMWTGFNTFKNSLTPLLGARPDPALTEEIRRTVMEYPGVIGVHDLMVHDYGVGNSVISLHAEVPCDMDFSEAHELIDDIEAGLRIAYKSVVTIHMDPVAVDDEETAAAKAAVIKVLSEIDSSLTLHDFRMTKGAVHLNLIFDLVTPYKFHIDDGELAQTVRQRLTEVNEHYFAIITVEKSVC